MARIRYIKPDFFLDDDIPELGMQARLLFIGLWTLADREGRLEDRPKKIKVQIFPYDTVDPEKLLSELTPKFIERYEVSGNRYIQVKNFLKHQRPHTKEADSQIPQCPKEQIGKARKSSGKPGKARTRTLIKGTGMGTGTGIGTGKEKDIAKPTASQGYEAETDIQRLMCAYKELQGFDPEDREWDRLSFAKWARAGNQLLKTCGSLDAALQFQDQFALKMKQSGLTWTLAAVARNAADEAARQRRREY